MNRFRKEKRNERANGKHRSYVWIRYNRDRSNISTEASPATFLPIRTFIFLHVTFSLIRLLSNCFRQFLHGILVQCKSMSSAALSLFCNWPSFFSEGILCSFV